MITITISLTTVKTNLRFCKQFLSLHRLIKLIKLFEVRYVLILNVSKTYEPEEKFVNYMKWILK